MLEHCNSFQLREALLLSIWTGYNQCVEFILQHRKFKVISKYKFLHSDSFWQVPSSNDSQFSSDITPLQLACQLNNLKIVRMLLNLGYRIETAHELNCKCNECHNRLKFDSVRHAHARLNTYKGMTSELYVCLTSEDPIQTCFTLRREVLYLAKKENMFKNDYLKMADNLSNFTFQLLDNIRGKNELDVILNKTGTENEEKFHPLARLDLAIKNEEKLVSLIFSLSQ